MSGIALIYHLDGRPADPLVLARMLDAIPYRACDGRGCWNDGPIAIGHAKLCATPESLHEIQPLSDEAGTLRLTFDGRVDNRADLHAALTAKGAQIRDDTDAELVLRACQVWGEEAPLRIIGDFAFAIWDGSARRLFCARDPIGAKTFYYYFDGRSFICASELHQILRHPEVVAEPNEGMIAETLVRTPSTREETFYQRIFRLEPSHWLTVNGGRLTKRRYYDLESPRPIRYAGDEQYAEHFLEIFRESVRCRLRCHKGAIIDLSGGLDSSSIAAVACAMRRDGDPAVAPFETFSVAFDHPAADERRYVADFEQMWQSRNHRLRPALLPLEVLTEQVLHYRDLPDYPNSALGDYDAELNGRDDFRVWIDGNGGDDWLTGAAPEYDDLLRGFDLFGVARRLRLDYRNFRRDPSYGNPLQGLLRQGFWRLLPWRIRRALRPLDRPAAIFPVTTEFARRTALGDRLAAMPPRPRFLRPSQYAMYCGFNAGWLTHPIEVSERWTARRRTDDRHPFFDRRIIEFVFALPDDQLLRDYEVKFVLRNAMRGLLPESIRRRQTKASFSHVYVETLEALGGARLFDSMEIASQGWVDAGAVAAAYRKMSELSSAGDIGYMRYIGPLWMVFAIELWFKLIVLGKR
ncbi:MAG: asparagine synthase-related protein [Candidatus Binataceae bacterium]